MEADVVRMQWGMLYPSLTDHSTLPSRFELPGSPFYQKRVLLNGERGPKVDLSNPLSES